VQGALVNADGEFELCTDLGNVKLLGFPVPADGFGPETQFTSEGVNAAGMVIVKVGLDYFIQTDGMTSNTYRIRYTFKNQFGGITFKEKTIKFFASPVSKFSSTNNCIVDDVVFKDESTLNATPFPAAITNWQWSFGDNDFSTAQNPSKRYFASGTYNVALRVTTSQGCTDISDPYSVRVGDVPIVNFNWSAICNNDLTKFADNTNPGTVSQIQTYTWDFGDGFILSGNAGDPVPPGTHGGSTIGSYKTPDHKYPAFGTYNTKLTVQTNDGCTNELTQRVFILPYNTIAPVAGSEYFEGFENNEGGWIPEAFNATNSTPFNIIKSDTSWIWGMPAGQVINASKGSTKAWWTGGNNGTYFANENSVVNGPCFNLSQLNRPMVALDYFSDSENNLDGAVLQYSTNGGLTWTIVGPPAGQLTRDEGINWFNGTGIFSNPGSQPIGNYGWTDKQGDWKNARFNLDMIPKADRGQVRLRIAFSSNDGNAAAFDGFAFDNFFVGEKKRNVLVEHFTTSALNASVNADAYLNNLYQNQFTVDRTQSDFYHIQYHVNFAGIDAINRDNPTDPAARALYYGVSQPPYSIMDGILKPNKFTGVTTEINSVELDRRSLQDPQFELTLDTIATGNQRALSVKLTLKAMKAVNVPLIAQVALVEEEVIAANAGTFKNVLRKLLLGSDGQTINLSFVKDQLLNINATDIELKVPIGNPSKLYLVGIIQDKNSKEILQSIVVKSPPKLGTVIVGIEEQPKELAALNRIDVFPNPANQEFSFLLPEGALPVSAWRLIDQRGVQVLSGDFSGAANGQLPVNISTLPNAIYYLVIEGADRRTAVRKKLIVMNRN
jgi:PKD repeat protein